MIALDVATRAMPAIASADAQTAAAWHDLDRCQTDANEREDWLVEAILVMPAQTHAGLLAKARVLAWADDYGDTLNCDDDALAIWAEERREHIITHGRAIGAIVRDLLRLTLEPAQ